MQLSKEDAGGRTLVQHFVQRLADAPLDAQGITANVFESLDGPGWYGTISDGEKVWSAPTHSWTTDRGMNLSVATPNTPDKQGGYIVVELTDQEVAGLKEAVARRHALVKEERLRLLMESRRLAEEEQTARDQELLKMLLADVYVTMKPFEEK